MRNKWSFLHMFSKSFEIVEIKDILFAHEIWEIDQIEISVHKTVHTQASVKLLKT